jgi:hypothetical protein
MPADSQNRSFWQRPSFWLRFLAYAIPLSFLLYVLYWNFLPFGYDATFTINVGAPRDTSGEFRLEPSKDLSAPMTADGSTYRELNGLAYAIFEPKAVLKNAQITVSVDGDGVSLIPPYIDFDPSSVNWDYSWDFEHNAYTLANPYFTNMSPTDASTGLIGNAFRFADSNGSYEYFDGKSKLELLDSQNEFENGPFTVYAEWQPENPNNDFQEIVGHYNWELIQDSTDVKFQIGRMNSNMDGPFYSVIYPVDSTFFKQEHSALAVYSPSNNGYIELYVDGNFAGRTYFGTSTISREYGSYNVTFGETAHGSSTPFIGRLFTTDIGFRALSQEATAAQFIYTAGHANQLLLSVVSDTTSTLNHLQLKVTE